MTVTVDDPTLGQLCEEFSYHVPSIVEAIKQRFPDYRVRPYRIIARINKMRERGVLPLDSGNYVSSGEILKGSSTLYDEDGNVKLQWVKTDRAKSDFLADFREAISDLVSENVSPLPTIESKTTELNDELATIYITNDVHVGALMWHEEVGKDYNIDIATSQVKRAYDYLMDNTPNSKVGIICDLGDLTEMTDYKNITPQSGHVLDVDGRFPKVLRAAYEMLLYGVERALQKHEIVYFYNIAGNHDPTVGDAVREIARVAFKNNPRVIVDDTPRPIKYHQHGTTMLQFAHGDGLKMHAAGEVMACDEPVMFSATKYRYAHFGHVHKDSVRESRLCRAESHRNLAPLNHWAFHKGFRGPFGTMKAITYSTEFGEISRNTFNVNM